MSRRDYEEPERLAQSEEDRYDLGERQRSGGGSGWLVAGLVVAGLGALA